MILKSLHHFFMFSFLRGQRLWWQREENQVKGQGQEERTGLDVPDKWGKGLKKQEERYDSAVHGLLFPPHLNLHFSSLHCFIYLDACWRWLSKITFSQQSLPLLPKLQPNQTVMTVKRRPNQPNQRRSPQPAQRPCSKQQGTRTKTRRRRKKAGLPGTVFSCWVTEQHLTITVVALRQGRGEWWFRVRERGKIKEEKGQRKEEKGKKKEVMLQCFILLKEMKSFWF